MSDLLLQFHQALGQSVAQVIETALAVEPAGGISPQWRQLLQRAGVEELPEDQRYQAARAQGLHKGAPCQEVEACLARLVGEAQGQIPLLPLDSGQRENVVVMLDALVPQGVERYQELARQRPAGGMFGHAFAAAQARQGQSEPSRRSYVLTCPNCGGPRLRPQDLFCEFCGGKTSQA